MAKRAQVLIVILWILLILTVLAVSTGHRVALGLKTSRYQRNSLKAYSLAKAGINLAILQLEKDAAGGNLDMLNEPWANNEDLFARVSLEENTKDYAVVGYNTSFEGFENTVFGVIDEERKINLNNASQEQLIRLFELCGASPAPEAARNFLIWRGDIEDEANGYASLGYAPKAGKLSNIEELLLVIAIEPDTYEGLREFVTVYGEKLNINTAGYKPLLAILEAAVGTLNSRGMTDITIAHAQGLFNKIEDYRNGDDDTIGTEDDRPFDNAGEVLNALNGFKEGLKVEEEAIINEIKDEITVRSEYFRLESKGISDNISRRLIAVYNRRDKKVVYWHEY